MALALDNPCRLIYISLNIVYSCNHIYLKHVFLKTKDKVLFNSIFLLFSKISFDIDIVWNFLPECSPLLVILKGKNLDVFFL